jgi:hypothetical protein
MSGNRNAVASHGESNCEISKEDVADPSSFPSQFSPSTNSDSDVDGIDTLLKHQSEVMFADHSEIFDSDSEFKNELVIRRSHLYEDCIAAVGNKNFM